MKAMINRVFSTGTRPVPARPVHTTMSSELTTCDIENYYLRIIFDCLRRMLVPSDTIEVSVRRSGVGPDGMISFAAYVRILKWDPVVSPVLLQNIPVVDGRIRKVVAVSVLLEGTHFAGIWFQATSDTEGAPKVLVGLPRQLVHQPG